jgi:hypothetical protein
MTALQIAQAECANWRKDGKGCLGAIIDDDLQIRRCCPKPKCVLGTPGERCLYFEECVAPMWRTMEDPVRKEEFGEAVRQYRLAAKLPSLELRGCPRCGRLIGRRKRYCSMCAAAQRRLTRREWGRAKRRMASTIKLVGTLENQGVSRGV